MCWLCVRCVKLLGNVETVSKLHTLYFGRKLVFWFTLNKILMEGSKEGRPNSASTQMNKQFPQCVIIWEITRRNCINWTESSFSWKFRSWSHFRAIFRKTVWLLDSKKIKFESWNEEKRLIIPNKDHVIDNSKWGSLVCCLFWGQERTLQRMRSP